MLSFLYSSKRFFSASIAWLTLSIAETAVCAWVLVFAFRINFISLTRSLSISLKSASFIKISKSESDKFSTFFQSLMVLSNTQLSVTISSFTSLFLSHSLCCSSVVPFFISSTSSIIRSSTILKSSLYSASDSYVKLFIYGNKCVSIYAYSTWGPRFLNLSGIKSSGVFNLPESHSPNTEPAIAPIPAPIKAPAAIPIGPAQAPAIAPIFAPAQAPPTAPTVLATASILSPAHSALTYWYTPSAIIIPVPTIDAPRANTLVVFGMKDRLKLFNFISFARCSASTRRSSLGSCVYFVDFQSSLATFSWFLLLNLLNGVFCALVSFNCDFFGVFFGVFVGFTLGFFPFLSLGCFLYGPLLYAGAFLPLPGIKGKSKPKPKPFSSFWPFGAIPFSVTVWFSESLELCLIDVFCSSIIFFSIFSKTARIFLLVKSKLSNLSFFLTSDGFNAALTNVKYFPNSSACFAFKTVDNWLFVVTAFE